MLVSLSFFPTAYDVMRHNCFGGQNDEENIFLLPCMVISVSCL